MGSAYSAARNDVSSLTLSDGEFTLGRLPAELWLFADHVDADLRRLREVVLQSLHQIPPFDPSKEKKALGMISSAAALLNISY